MALRIYNTLTRKKETFRPRQGKKVRMFVCGPTVYNLSHIGHGRTYVVFDMVARYLRHQGYEVMYLQNITDIDDKIIERAKRQSQKPEYLARAFEHEYLKDTAALHITSVDIYARATDAIAQITKQVQTLLKKHHAYKIENEGYYFDLTTFPDYGKLSRRTAEGAEDAVSRIDESVQKKNRGDFALWKFSKPDEPFWETPLGKGRPGWHIEDTAITEQYLGSQYDIHGGAVDLIFPHHEAEIAQQESASGKKPFVAYWMHAGFLTVGGEKMSKSKGNFLTIRELLETWPADVFRLFVLSAHYRSPIDYDTDLLAQAAAGYERLRQFARRVNEIVQTKQTEKVTRTSSHIRDARDAFFASLDDDFDTPKALAALFSLIRKLNPLIETKTLIRKDALALQSLLSEFQHIFGVEVVVRNEYASIPKEILDLMTQREKLRQEKEFAKADTVRKRIEEQGFLVEDSPSGPRIKPKR